MMPGRQQALFQRLTLLPGDQPGGLAPALCCAAGHELLEQSAHLPSAQPTSVGQLSYSGITEGNFVEHPKVRSTFELHGQIRPTGQFVFRHGFLNDSINQYFELTGRTVFANRIPSSGAMRCKPLPTQALARDLNGN